MLGPVTRLAKPNNFKRFVITRMVSFNLIRGSADDTGLADQVSGRDSFTNSMPSGRSLRIFSIPPILQLPVSFRIVNSPPCRQILDSLRISYLPLGLKPLRPVQMDRRRRWIDAARQPLPLHLLLRGQPLLDGEAAIRLLRDEALGIGAVFRFSSLLYEFPAAFIAPLGVSVFPISLNGSDPLRFFLGAQPGIFGFLNHG